ncbi:hypothetical protein ABZZ20_35310 [Streptomyces sp. NPDC006430]|uniref:hypothetical protein n=1 Tax=Streptomyces sp. NPDC006430 TaxID=3154299 RepID=UPI0033BEB4BF
MKVFTRNSRLCRAARSVVEEVWGDQLIAGIQAVQRRRDCNDELVLRIAGEISDAGRLAGSVIERFEERRPMFAEHVRAGLILPPRVEYVAAEDLEVNPRSGKIVRWSTSACAERDGCGWTRCAAAGADRRCGTFATGRDSARRRRSRPPPHISCAGRR